ncbi:hypothetical protein NP233_g3209 [Leucocoprinus birnbaumii]|uniref:F-box protein n=1 Tax=Leucocoprinus birnbaumii TaxID=56174 RepID=A0AAD5YWM0_9AGAR|nr:hypothetical protein NP233_g3209 [Leucocoprinus birnbaumii]
MEQFLRRVEVIPPEETDDSGAIIENVPRRNALFEMACCNFLQGLPRLRVLHFLNVNFNPVAVDSELFRALSIALRGVVSLDIKGDGRNFPLHILANCSRIKTLKLDLRNLAVNGAGTPPSNWLLEPNGAAASPTTVDLHHGNDVGLRLFGKVFTTQPARFSFRMLRILQLDYCEIAAFTREDLAHCRPGDHIPPVSWDGGSSTQLASAILRNAGEALEKLVMIVRLLDQGNSFISTKDMAGICNLRTLVVILFIRPSYLLTVLGPRDPWLERLIQSLPSPEKLERFRLQYTVCLEAEDDEAVLRTLRDAMHESLDKLLFRGDGFFNLKSFEFEIELFKKGRRLSPINLSHPLADFFPSISTRGSDLRSSIRVTMHPFRQV